MVSTPDDLMRNNYDYDVAACCVKRVGLGLTGGDIVQEENEFAVARLHVVSTIRDT